MNAQWAWYSAPSAIQRWSSSFVSRGQLLLRFWPAASVRRVVRGKDAPHQLALVRLRREQSPARRCRRPSVPLRARRAAGHLRDARRRGRGRQSTCRPECGRICRWKSTLSAATSGAARADSVRAKSDNLMDGPRAAGKRSDRASAGRQSAAGGLLASFVGSGLGCKKVAASQQRSR